MIDLIKEIKKVNLIKDDVLIVSLKKGHTANDVMNMNACLRSLNLDCKFFFDDGTIKYKVVRILA